MSPQEMRVEATAESTTTQRSTLATLLSDGGLFVDGDWIESKDQDPEGDVRLVQLADVGDGFYADKSARFLTSQKARELKCTFLERGDILVARMPDPLGRACIFPGDNLPCVTVVDVCVIRPGANAERRWLLHAINSPSFRRQIERHIKGTTRQRISRTNLGTIELDVPRVDEQRRIADILDKADAIRRKRKQTIALTEDLLRSAFLDMLGDPVTNPKGERLTFARAPLELIDGDRGKSYPKSEEFTASGHCLFLSAKNVTSDGFAFSDRQFIGPDRDRELSKGKLSRRDVILTTRGTLGNSAYYSDSVPFDHVRINSGMLILRADERGLLSEFLYFYLRSPHFLNQVALARSGSAQPQLPVRTLNGMTLLLPTPAVQRECVKFFSGVELHRARHNDGAGDTDRLFDSLVHLGFSGGLK